MKNDNKNKSSTWHMAICLLGKYLARQREKKIEKLKIDGGW